MYISKIVNCPIELQGKLPVPDIHNCPASARSQFSHLLPVPHIFVSSVLRGAQVTVLKTVCPQNPYEMTNQCCTTLYLYFESKIFLNFSLSCLVTVVEYKTGDLIRN